MSQSSASPLTSNSTFTWSYIVNQEKLVDFVLLCYWDNILGPRIQHLWQINDIKPLSSSLAMYTCTKTLSGEICREFCESGIDYKLYSIPDKQQLVLALIFNTTNVSSLGVNSLLIVMPPEQRCWYLQKHTLILRCFKRIITKLKVYFSKDSVQHAVNRFSCDLSNIFAMLDCLHQNCLPQVIQLRDTGFSPSHPMDDDFLRKALASHLSTMGRTVVVGKNPHNINLLISTLAVFNSPSERVCSRYVNSDQDKFYPYHQDLWLQGLITDSINVLDTLTREILSSQYPTTIIDLQNREIFQSLHCPEHFSWHHHTLISEITALYLNDSDSESITFPKRMFIAFDHPETIAQSCLSEINMLPHDLGVRESYIEHFSIFLKRKALALIKYIETETHYGSILSRLNSKKLKQVLELTLEGDFRIVMAIAEKLKPGLYSFLVRDKRELDSTHSYDSSSRIN